MNQNNINTLTEKIIGCAFRVHNTLGCGFLEKVYENALAHELKKNSLTVAQQQSIRVLYDGVSVGDYAADILVESLVILELKAAQAIDKIHEAQLLNYLKATGLTLGLILNFGQPKLQIRRRVNNL